MKRKAGKPHGEWRRARTGAKAVDAMCHNHGQCNWCRSNRLISVQRQMRRADDVLSEYVR